MQTNRDFYLFIATFRENAGENRRSLEEYLRAVYELGAAERARNALPLPLFAKLLQDALTRHAPAYDTAWARDTASDGSSEGFARWEKVVREQIVDLRQMDHAGTLKNEMRYFGVNAPRGSRWYNFDPFTFLECAAAGSFGGWEEGDDTGREYVPGEVAVMDDEGNITSADPRELDHPIVEMPSVTWDEFARFLRMGQWYE